MEAASETTLASATPVLTWGDLGFTLLMLTIVLLVILALAWLAKRFNLGVPNKTTSQIQVLSTTLVGSKERVVVLKVGSKRFLLGVTAHQIQLLKELPDDFENKLTTKK